MSKLEQLIEELCPNGVEYKRLDEICEISRGIVISKQDIVDNIGGYPVYSSQTENNGELGKIKTYAYDGEYLTWTTDGANAGTIFYRNGKFNVTNVCGLLKNMSQNNLVRFLYHVLSVEAPKYVRNGMGNPKLMSNVMGSITVPLPPLPVQREIVRILDAFSEYTTELKKELREELTMRKKQYEYYRDSLLSFGDEVEWKTLGEIAHYSKDKINSSEINEYSYVGVDNLLQNKQGITISNYVPKEGRLTKYETNNILIGNIRPYLRKIWFSSNFGGASGDVLVIQSNYNKLLPKYLFFTLSSEDFFNYNIKNSKGAKMPRGNKDSIMKYKIPLPPLEEQQRIVDILDRFDTLCNDISKGLPTEIEARQKQYEYYRDKLLTFKNIND